MLRASSSELHLTCTPREHTELAALGTFYISLNNIKPYTGSTAKMAAASSPSSSPRLPSPPPIAEDQIGPTSPGVSLFEDTNSLAGISNIDAGASRRIRPGTKAIDMAEGPPLVELQEVA